MDDPSLASEMIKLLRDELERIRAQIREERAFSQEEQHSENSLLMVTPGELYTLQGENVQLRKELEAAQARLAAVPGVMPVACQDIQEQRELQLEETRKTQLDAESLARKVAAARAKCQQNKSKKGELESSISALGARLDELKARRAEEGERLEVLQNEVRERGDSPAHFDPVQFLQDPQYAGDDESSTPAEVLVSSIGSSVEFPKVERDLWVPDGHISKSLDEVLWPARSQSRSRFISLSTTHRFNPKMDNSRGSWQLEWNMEHRGVREFFYMTDMKWYYLGTYQWIGQSVAPQKEIRGLIFSRMHFLYKRAVLFPDTLPPAFASIAKTMIDSGVLKIACNGWRRVGFNTQLADALQFGRPSTSTADGSAEFPRPANAISIPKEGARSIATKATKRTSDSPQDGPRKRSK